MRNETNPLKMVVTRGCGESKTIDLDTVNTPDMIIRNTMSFMQANQEVEGIILFLWDGTVLDARREGDLVVVQEAGHA